MTYLEELAYQFWRDQADGADAFDDDSAATKLDQLLTSKHALPELFRALVGAAHRAH